MSVIDKLIRTRRRTLGLQITRDAQLVVRAPHRAPLEWIARFVNDKLGWIRQKQNEVRNALLQIPKRDFNDGAQYIVLGENVRLTVLPNSDASLEFNLLGFSIGEHNRATVELQFEEWYRAHARRVITESLERIAGPRQLKFTGPRITGAKTRWGSCSSKGALSFSWHLVKAPQWVIDYVVAHELAHLSEHNHSRRFWTGVETLFPRFQEARRWLRANQPCLLV